MIFTPVNYHEPVFRPPAEAYSAIIQATIGCSWNKCAFCEMYTSKKFTTRPEEEIFKEIELLADYYRGTVKKVFLADGNAFVLSAGKLTPLLKEIGRCFGQIQRISSYALPKDILAKSDDELKYLRSLGLKLLYIGIETGDDDLLQRLHKGETFQTAFNGIQKAHNAGIDTSIMIINGLGGKKYSRQHALKSAEIINLLNPRFLSTLTLSLPYGYEHFANRFEGDYQQQSMVELMEELYLFIENLSVKNVIFRSNHVSNQLALSGTLSRDQDRLLKQLDEAIRETPPGMMPQFSGVL